MTEAAQDPGELAERLLARLRLLDGVVVAFSGGVDSTLVLLAAIRALPADRVRAAIADSPSLARTELALARTVAGELGVELIEIPTAELDDPGYRRNSGDRCYFCKHTVLSAVSAVAARHGIRAVATGTHADDHLAAHRPGLRAARELEVVEPLAEAGLGKREVRLLARHWSLRVADKPAMPCLASRIAVGVPVTIGRLNLVEQAEAALREQLTGAGLTARDLRVRLLERGFRVELDQPAHGALIARPATAVQVLSRLEELIRTGPGQLSVYRLPATTGS